MKVAFLYWCLGTTTLFAQSTAMGSRTMEGDWDASGAKTTKPAKMGTVLPATCSAGEAFFKTDAAGGQNLYLCKPDNAWTQVSGGVASVFGRSGSIGAQSGDYTFSQIGGTISGGQLPVAGGDLTGGLVSATVTGIQNRPVGTTEPAAGNVLAWTGSQWAPGAAGGAVTSKALVFDSTTMVSGETMTSWSCGSGSGATCTTSWTVPAGVTWVHVVAWSGGGGGGGSWVNGYGSAGGSGGGYASMICPVTPGASVTVVVGQGGPYGTGNPGGGGTSAGDGGATSFGSCVSLLGGGAGNYAGAPNWAGRLANSSQLGWVQASGDGTGIGTTCQGSSSTSRLDGGGCGAQTTPTGGSTDGGLYIRIYG
jgi:hypothetical protein